MNFVSSSQIDDAILLVVGDRWMKVAKVIAMVGNSIGRDLPSGDEGDEIISERIEILIQSGRLQAQGNIKKWRFSEVRRFKNQDQ